jgi:hypothetical protein
MSEMRGKMFCNTLSTQIQQLFANCWLFSTNLRFSLSFFVTRPKSTPFTYQVETNPIQRENASNVRIQTFDHEFSNPQDKPFQTMAKIADKNISTAVFPEVAKRADSCLPLLSTVYCQLITYSVTAPSSACLTSLAYFAITPVV